MWIFTTRGFYSIVQSDKPDHMLVRSRFRGDIENLFPDIEDAEVVVTPERDYLYRAVVHRDTVQIALANLVPDIDYPNFKDAVLDDRRHPAYGEVWYTMYRAGDSPPPPARFLIPKRDKERKEHQKRKRLRRASIRTLAK
jgi:hypothetical protein